MIISFNSIFLFSFQAWNNPFMYNSETFIKTKIWSFRYHFNQRLQPFFKETLNFESWRIKYGFLTIFFAIIELS